MNGGGKNERRREKEKRVSGGPDFGPGRGNSPSQPMGPPPLGSRRALRRREQALRGVKVEVEGGGGGHSGGGGGGGEATGGRRRRTVATRDVASSLHDTVLSRPSLMYLGTRDPRRRPRARDGKRTPLHSEP